MQVDGSERDAVATIEREVEKGISAAIDAQARATEKLEVLRRCSHPGPLGKAEHYRGSLALGRLPPMQPKADQRNVCGSQALIGVRVCACV